MESGYDKAKSNIRPDKGHWKALDRITLAVLIVLENNRLKIKIAFIVAVLKQKLINIVNIK